jgi:photosystem II stability/assembly factor-like uncharacterized protein
MDEVYTARKGKVWVQPGGANNKLYPLACADLGDLSEPYGDNDLIRCRDNDGKLQAVGASEGVPDFVTVTITELLAKERSYLEGLKCPYALYVMQRCTGRADIFSNYDRGELLTHVRNSQRTFSNLAMREDDSASTIAMDVQAWPPLFDIDKLTAIVLGDDIGNEDLTDVVANIDERCINQCGFEGLDLGAEVWVSTDAPTGLTAEVRYSTDFGANFNTPAAQPFIANENISALTRILMSAIGVRILVSKEGTGGAIQGQVSYTDDAGTTWNDVNIGGAAAGHGAVNAGGLFGWARNFVWLASAAGYIYKSEDGGETWTAKEAGAIMTDDYYHIHFADEKYGIAGGEGGIIALTEDGGETWHASGAAPSAAVIYAVARLDKQRLWAADAGGDLWYSNDAGDSWTQRTGWTNSSIGIIADMRWLVTDGGYHGWLTVKDAGGDSHIMITFNGGYDWIEVVIPPDCDIRAIWPVKPNLAYAVGTISPVPGSAANNLAVVLRIEAE